LAGDPDAVDDNKLTRFQARNRLRKILRNPCALRLTVKFVAVVLHGLAVSRNIVAGESGTSYQ
jgi:hypothetical protein